MAECVDAEVVTVSDDAVVVDDTDGPDDDIEDVNTSEEIAGAVDDADVTVGELTKTVSLMVA